MILICPKCNFPINYTSMPRICPLFSFFMITVLTVILVMLWFIINKWVMEGLRDTMPKETILK